MISTVALIGLATFAVSSQYSAFPDTNNSAGQIPTGQDPSFPTGQDPSIPTGLDPSFPTAQIPGYPTGQDPGYQTGQVPGYPTRQDPGNPIKQVPGYPTSEVPGYPSRLDPGFLTRQDPGFPTGQDPGYPTGKVPAYPTRQDHSFPNGQISDLSAKEVPSFSYVQISDLLTGQVPGFQTGQDPGFPTRQDPGFPTGQDPGFTTRQEPGFPTGQISDLSAKEVPSFLEVSGFPTGQASGFPNVQASDLVAGQERGFRSGQVPGSPAGQDPGFPTSPDFSIRHVPNFPIEQVPSYTGWPPGNPISSYPPSIQGSPIDYYQQPQLLDKRDQDPSFSTMVRLPNIPLYTSLLKDFDQAIQEVYKHITLFTGVALTSLPENNPLIQYIAIVFTINEMIEALAKEIPITTESVLQTYKEARNNPMAAASVVSSRLNKTINQIALIREFIIQKQQTDCKKPDSYECNLIIDTALASSTDFVLKQQAKFLASLSQELKLFNTDYAIEFDKLSKNGGALNYLKSAHERRLKPFLEAAARVRKLGLGAPMVWVGV